MSSQTGEEVVVVRSLPLVGGGDSCPTVGGGGLPSWGQEKMVGGVLTPLHTMNKS